MSLAILLLGLGLALIVAEVLVPSFGMLGLLATLSIIAAVVVAFRAGSGLSFAIATAVLVPAVVLVGFKLIPQGPLARHFVNEGYSEKDQRAIDRRDAELFGAEGEVLAQLRPAGVARLAGRRVDVVSRGELIEAGARVRVIELQGNRVVVARAKEPEELAAPRELGEGHGAPLT